MTPEVVSPNYHVSTSALRAKYLKIPTYGSLIPNEGSTIMTTAISDHDSLLQE